MKDESGITKLKLAVIVILGALVVYGIFYLSNSNKKRSMYNFINEENKVVYREQINMPIDSDTITPSLSNEIISINEIHIDSSSIKNSVPVKPNSTPKIPDDTANVEINNAIENTVAVNNVPEN